ncbi:protein SSUH2 homolog [Dreissena polymorpha]|uniref:protein SSUH2 homolog n=1 Tax=Dreissena polymorpha TaxID=45954 RepID=UPI002264C3DA|nr:protein SSUH2 homolog [Dreissena polymorpha]
MEDNPNAVPTAPSAPPLEKMDSVVGYSNIGFDGAMLQPPSYEESSLMCLYHTFTKGSFSALFVCLPRIDEHEARQALLQHVAENCCYGKGAATELTLNDLIASSAFHYTLETFGEARSTAWAYEPNTGQVIDGPHNGPAPGPWDIQATPPAVFQDQKTFIEVPHTASVKPCHNCLAMGRIRCHRCFGRGRVRCTWCNGNGHKTEYRNGKHERERCHWCHGHGRRSCDTCHGYGMVTCSGCQGHCNLKCYIRLTIIWTNHIEDHIVERTMLPDHLIRTVSGQVAFSETQPRVWPVNHFPDGEINNASNRLVAQHASAFPSERILMQRHQVRIIPVTQALYKWKGADSDFFVYGFEKKVYAPNYPQQCCCGCSIL